MLAAGERCSAAAAFCHQVTVDGPLRPLSLTAGRGEVSPNRDAAVTSGRRSAPPQGLRVGAPASQSFPGRGLTGLRGVGAAAILLVPPRPTPSGATFSEARRRLRSSPGPAARREEAQRAQRAAGSRLRGPAAIRLRRCGWGGETFAAASGPGRPWRARCRAHPRLARAPVHRPTRGRRACRAPG